MRSIVLGILVGAALMVCSACSTLGPEVDEISLQSYSEEDDCESLEYGLSHFAQVCWRLEGTFDNAEDAVFDFYEVLRRDQILGNIAVEDEFPQPHGCVGEWRHEEHESELKLDCYVALSDAQGNAIGFLWVTSDYSDFEKSAIARGEGHDGFWAYLEPVAAWWDPWF